MISTPAMRICVLNALLFLGACGGSDGTAQSSDPEAGDAGESTEPAAFDPELEMAACQQQHSLADCLFVAMDRYGAATECGSSAISVNPARRARLKMAYEKTDKAHLTCMEASQWKLSACAAAAACDVDKIRRCVDQQLARANECPRAPRALLDAIESCTEL